MGPLSVIVWIALTAGRPQPADVTWTATVPLWTSLSPGGKVIDAGPGPNWAGPPPAARLGSLPAMPPEVESAPKPRELPALRSEPVGAVLPPGTPAPQLSMTSPNLVAVAAVPEPVSPPLVAQATQRRPIHSAGDLSSFGTLAAPAGRPNDALPAARLAAPVH